MYFKPALNIYQTNKKTKKKLRFFYNQTKIVLFMIKKNH